MSKSVYYDQLSPQGKASYDALMEKLPRHHVPISIPFDPLFDYALIAVTREQPSLLDFYPYAGTRFFSGGGKTFLEPNFVMKADDVTRLLAEGKRLAETFRRENDYLTLLAIQDYIIDEIVYSKGELQPSDFLAMGPLLYKRGVCQGISLFAELMFENLGGEGYLAYGRYEGEMHCWNVVKVDGIWQNIDFTHNLNFSHKELRRYDSFCVSNDVLFTSHHLDPTTPKYVCEEHHLNYYWQMPLHLMRHSDIPILAKVLDENKAVAFLVKKEMSLDAAARKVVDACTLSGYHFSLSVNEDRHVIGIIAHK